MQRTSPRTWVGSSHLWVPSCHCSRSQWWYVDMDSGERSKRCLFSGEYSETMVFFTSPITSGWDNSIASKQNGQLHTSAFSTSHFSLPVHRRCHLGQPDALASHTCREVFNCPLTHSGLCLYCSKAGEMGEEVQSGCPPLGVELDSEKRVGVKDLLLFLLDP